MENWLGNWELLPDLSHYAAGNPPDWGSYLIARVGDEIAFTVRWDAGAGPQEIRFSAVPDGRAASFPGVDQFSVTAVDGDTLESEAIVGGKRVAWARRRVSADGGLMTVLQENTGAGGPITVFQVYRRADA